MNISCYFNFLSKMDVSMVHYDEPLVVLLDYFQVFCHFFGNQQWDALDNFQGLYLSGELIFLFTTLGLNRPYEFGRDRPKAYELDFIK